MLVPTGHNKDRVDTGKSISNMFSVFTRQLFTRRLPATDLPAIESQAVKPVASTTTSELSDRAATDSFIPSATGSSGIFMQSRLSQPLLFADQPAAATRSASAEVVTAAPVAKNTTEVPNSSLRKLYRNSMLAVGMLAATSVIPAFARGLPDFAALVEAEGDAVVKISVIAGAAAAPANGLTPEQLEQLPEFMRRFYEPERQRRGGGFGSGFIISDDGYVITNAHVVDNASEIRVSLSDQREYDAELVGSDKRSDIAVLKLEGGTLPTVRMGDSDDVRVGEWVLAIGSPFGFEHTATQGIVSAVARNLPDDTYVPFIQTDVAVNPGNSGGPLFNTDGEVVGVNSQIYSRSGGYQGLSFSIPINVARSIADQIITKGYASRGWLGVQIQDVNQALAESFGLDRPTGALIAQVIDDSPALAAGFKTGDIILEFNGKTVDGSSKLPPMVGAVVPNSDVPVNILRGGERLSLTVTIAELEADKPIRKAKMSTRDTGIGVTVQSLQASELDEVGLEHGVAVTAVDPESPAAKAGIQNGDIIVSVNRRKVTTPQVLDSISSDLPAGKSVPVLVQRGELRTFVPVDIPAS